MCGIAGWLGAGPSEAGVAERIDLRLGPAFETLRAMPADEPFDFAFIDADKVGYLDYYEETLRLLRPGGLAMIDNVLRGGRVTDPDPDDEGHESDNQHHQCRRSREVGERALRSKAEQARQQPEHEDTHGDDERCHRCDQAAEAG